MYQLVLILVADDEGIQPFLASMIEAGFHVKISCSTDEALLQLSSARGAYRAVMVDSGLTTESCDEAIKRVHDIDSSMPIIDFSLESITEQTSSTEDEELPAPFAGLISALKQPSMINGAATFLPRT